MYRVLEGEPEELPHHLRPAGRLHQVQMLGLSEVTTRLIGNVAWIGQVEKS